MKQQGYNHNIHHMGLVFHIQTEDYGQDTRKVVTQLFCQGQIICKLVGMYDEHMENPNLKEKVVALMQDQHKKMLKDLRNGLIVLPANLKVKEA